MFGNGCFTHPPPKNTADKLFPLSRTLQATHRGDCCVRKFKFYIPLCGAGLCVGERFIRHLFGGGVPLCGTGCVQLLRGLASAPTVEYLKYISRK
jgi:hypothetical protein